MKKTQKPITVVTAVRLWNCMTEPAVNRSHHYSCHWNLIKNHFEYFPVFTTYTFVQYFQDNNFRMWSSLVRFPSRNSHVFLIYTILYIPIGARGGVVVKPICYKPAGSGFDSRWCYWNFSVTYHVIIPVALWS